MVEFEMRITLRRINRLTKFKVFWDAHSREILPKTKFYFTPKKKIF
jgi:hypothetical protein